MEQIISNLLLADNEAIQKVITKFTFFLFFIFFYICLFLGTFKNLNILLIETRAFSGLHSEV